MRECSLRVELAEECELRKGLQEHIKQLQGSAGKSFDSYCMCIFGCYGLLVADGMACVMIGAERSQQLSEELEFVNIKVKRTKEELDQAVCTIKNGYSV
jgi:hypothetical protein